MDFGINQGVVEELYLRYRDNPRAVDDQWREFFDNLADPDREQLTRGEPVRNISDTLVGMPAPTAARAPSTAPVNGGANGNGAGKNGLAHARGNGNGNGHHAAAMYDRPSVAEDVFGG